MGAKELRVVEERVTKHQPTNSRRHFFGFARLLKVLETMVRILGFECRV